MEIPGQISTEIDTSIASAFACSFIFGSFQRQGCPSEESHIRKSARTQKSNGAATALTLNVIQENVMRGGLSARSSATTDQHGRWRRGRMVTTRAVANIDQDVKLNKALWPLGERVASSLRPAA